MKVFKLLALVALISMHAFAQSGEGTSDRGGGVITRDINNPWFLSNTKEVRYCINIDEMSMELSRKDAEIYIQRALQFWIKQFSEIPQQGVFGSKPILATQTFILENCNARTTDLYFQLGVLSNEQKKYFANVKNYIGQAVRTEYDKKILKARGFIYIAPSKGPLKPDMDNVAWSLSPDVRFESVVAHELGHVFGIQHTEHIDLMSETFPEQRAKVGSTFFSTYYTTDLFNRDINNVQISGHVLNNGPLYKFFNLKDHMSFDAVYLSFKNNVATVTGVSSGVLGRMEVQKFVDSESSAGFNSRIPLVRLWVPTEQIFFEKKSNMSENSHIIASYSPTIYQGLFYLANGEVRSFSIELSQNGYAKIAGTIDGIHYPILGTFNTYPIGNP